MARIRVDSRYAPADILIDENGVKFLDWQKDIKFDVSLFDDNVQHTVLPEDTVFSVSSRYLQSQRYYWVVCRANVILNPFEKLVPGSKLIVPSIRNLRTKILGEAET